MTQTEIGAWLADRREAAGLTQMQAAARVGKDSGLISKWERGALRMSAESFIELVVLYSAAQELAKWLAAIYQPPAATTRVQRVAEPGPIIPAAPSPKRAAASKKSGRRHAAGE